MRSIRLHHALLWCLVAGGLSYNCGKMICISCIIRATILRCDYPVLYVLRFYVVSTTIFASILRCDPTFAEICTLAFADVTQADVISCPLVSIATNWTILRSHPFKMSIRCDNIIIKLQDFTFSSFKISLRCSIIIQRHQ